MDIEEKKSLTSSWFRELRDMFCEEFVDIDSGSFERKNWDHKFEGGGEMSLMKGEVFEKVGVNISTVSGKFDNDFKSEVKGTDEAPNYWASGISLVAHMQSPKVPAFHFNTRYIVTGDSWFGGGGDLTPTIKKDCLSASSAKYISFGPANADKDIIFGSIPMSVRYLTMIADANCSFEKKNSSFISSKIFSSTLSVE